MCPSYRSPRSPEPHSTTTAASTVRSHNQRGAPPATTKESPRSAPQPQHSQKNKTIFFFKGRCVPEHQDQQAPTLPAPVLRLSLQLALHRPSPRSPLPRGRLLGLLPATVLPSPWAQEACNPPLPAASMPRSTATFAVSPHHHPRHF